MRIRNQATVAAATLLLATFAAPLSAGAMVKGSAVTWIAPTMTVPSSTTYLGDAANDVPMDLRVVLNPANPEALSQFIYDVSTPGNPMYQRYLKTGEFASRFGASASAIAGVTNALRASGLSVSRISPNHLVLRVSGSAAGVEAAFHTTVGAYRDASGTLGYVANRRIGLDSTVAGFVAGVTGLNTFEHPHSTIQPSAPGSPRAQLSSPTACSAAASAAASRGEYLPNEIANAYGIDNALANGFDGSGHSVALVEFASYYKSDMTAYFNCFGLSNTINDIVMNGGPSPDSAADGGAEVELDMQQIAGLAPGATINNYLHPNDSGGFVDEFNQIAIDNNSDAVSVSWGMCESHVSSGAQQPLLQQLAAQGQTVFVAAGDSGSSSCAYNAQPGVPGVEYGNVVDDPSNSPWVTAIGGLTVTSINPLSQSVWGGTCGGGAPCGGGGGSSNAYGRPSWQVGPGVALNNHRQVPDISVMGDPRTGMLAYFSGGWHGFGGTSIGAPILGAMMAVGAQACGLQNLGFINPRLYQMAINGTGIIDVTTGSNDLYNTGYYSAVSGFDMASGLGSPDPSSFLPTLCGQEQSFATTSAGVGAASTWTFHYFSSGAALTAGSGTITVHGFVDGGFSSTASDYTINGTQPSAVIVSGANVTLTVGATINALSAVTLVVNNATNATAIGKASIEVTDSNSYSAMFQTAYVASRVGSVALSGAATAGTGTSGAAISVTVRNASNATLAGVPVTINVPSGTYIVDTSNGLTNVHGVATFRVVSGATGSRSITATAGGTTSAAISINFTNPWKSSTRSFVSKAGALTGQLVASTNCGTVGRTSKGALYSSISAVNATLTSSKGAALLPVAASDPDAADGAGSTCLISYVGKDGKVRLVSIASGTATATILNTSSSDKAATASPGIAVVGSTIYVANLSSSGYLMVSSTDGTTTTRDNISSSNGVAKATGSGYALARSVAVANGVPSIALRVSKNIYVFSYNATYGNWAPTNIADLARWSITGSSAFAGNPTLAGGTTLALYAHTAGLHLVEVTPDLENAGFWNTNDITDTFSSLKTKSDVVVFGSSARQLAVIVGSSVTVLSANGPASQPWIPVTVTFAGAKSLFAYANGSLGASTGSKLATFSS